MKFFFFFFWQNKPFNVSNKKNSLLGRKQSSGLEVPKVKENTACSGSASNLINLKQIKRLMLKSNVVLDQESPCQ